MGGFLAALGVAALAIGAWLRARTRRDAVKRTAWPVLPGSVLNAGLSLQKHSGDGGGTFTRFGARYGYTVDGADHSGYFYSDNAKNHAALVERYPAGAPVDVYYDPAKAQRSEVREPLVAMGGWSAGLGPLSWCLLGLGGFFALVGVAMQFN